MEGTVDRTPVGPREISNIKSLTFPNWMLLQTKLSDLSISPPDSALANLKGDFQIDVTQSSCSVAPISSIGNQLPPNYFLNLGAIHLLQWLDPIVQCFSNIFNVLNDNFRKPNIFLTSKSELIISQEKLNGSDTQI